MAQDRLRRSMFGMHSEKAAKAANAKAANAKTANAKATKAANTASKVPTRIDLCCTCDSVPGE